MAPKTYLYQNDSPAGRFLERSGPLCYACSIFSKAILGVPSWALMMPQ